MAGAGKRRFNRTEKPRAGKKELAKWEAIKERPLGFKSLEEILTGGSIAVMCPA